MIRIALLIAIFLTAGCKKNQADSDTGAGTDQSRPLAGKAPAEKLTEAEVRTALKNYYTGIGNDAVKSIVDVEVISLVGPLTKPTNPRYSDDMKSPELYYATCRQIRKVPTNSSVLTALVSVYREIYGQNQGQVVVGGHFLDLAPVEEQFGKEWLQRHPWPKSAPKE